MLGATSVSRASSSLANKPPRAQAHLTPTSRAMAGRKTRKSTAEDAGADRAALEAFYMRVMHRVCRAYRERSGNGDAAALLEQVGGLS